jgi:hypothetical protein
MGSEVMTTTVEQKGRIKTNPGNLSPDTSKPIEQQDQTPTTVAPSQPIEQLSGLGTAGGSGTGSSSKPLEQQLPDKFPSQAGTTPDDSIIEQKKAQRNTTENPDTPIEQVVFVTANLRATSNPSQPIEQRLLRRDTLGDEPIEQVAKETNTIQITQFNFSDLIFPPCNSIKNPVTTNILWRIKDFGFPFNVGTLIFIVDGTPVQDTSNFTVTPIANGLQLDYDPPAPFDFDADVEIQVYISDNAIPPNNFTYHCIWHTVGDNRPPLITLISPECDETGVEVREPVVFSVFDSGEGVEQDSVVLSIEGIPVCSGLTFEAITTNSGSGFTVTWDHLQDPFRFDANISVAIEATDLAVPSNSGFFVCSFNTEESSAPEFMNFDPEPCETFVDNTTDLTFEVYGNVDGVDISTLEVRIDNSLRRVYVRPRILRSE